MSNNLKDFYNANSQEVIENALKYHFQTLVNYSNNDSFIKIKNDIISSTIETQLVSSEGNQISEEEILLSKKSSLILGAPGVGKTVFIKRLISRIIGENLNFDILLLLRGQEITNNSIIKSIRAVLNLHDEIKESELIDILLNNKTIIFIDGIDEIYQAEIESILLQVESMIRNQRNLKVILTSRIATIARDIGGIDTYQIQSPTSERILKFIKSFNLGERFISELNQSGYQELASSPLILSQLIRIFEAHGSLPYNRKTLYRYIIFLYLEEWDVMRSIRRVSKFRSFDNDLKFDFLTVLAYKTTIEYSSYLFEKSKLIKIIKSFIQEFRLSESDIVDIIEYLVESTGLLIQNGVNTYSFLHRSIQEYLAANYLIRLPSLPMKYFQENPDIYAIATTLSSQPSLFKEFIMNSIESKSKQAFSQYEIRLKEELKTGYNKA